MVLGADGKKMSKRNTSKTADDYVKTYGSDALRLHMMFSLKYIDGGVWNDEGLKHMRAFMERVERIVLKWKDCKTAGDYGKDEKELDFVLNRTIKEVAENFESFSFNSAVARIMELVNAMYKYDVVGNNGEFKRKVMKDLLILLAPATPHFAEELWEQIGEKYSIFNQHYPTFDESKISLEKVEIAVQLNSKIVARLDVETSLSEDELLKAICENDVVKKQLEGKQIVKKIIVPNRLVNLIVK